MSSLVHNILRLYIDEFTPNIREKGSAFAASNIALCKYWGKRDQKLNLPINNSLSLSLGGMGSFTSVTPISTDMDVVIYNGNEISPQNMFFKKTIEFCDLFRQFGETRFLIETSNNIPTKAGLASSASGFAALTLALFRLYSIPERSESLSRVARLGSGSACRSFHQGFCEWICGKEKDGTDSLGIPFKHDWTNLRIGFLKLICTEKKVGSREAMESSSQTSPFFKQWTKQATYDLVHIKKAIIEKDFIKLGEFSENNALKMHATMISSYPTLLYWQEETLTNMKNIWKAREKSIPVYFTLDAGPNLKLLFTQETEEIIKKTFPDITIINPFNKP
ncbi:diphosphomevalonate decarboxylase [Candidatus Liberibacter sp.]|uniref:diphosphomevalonate decarboxylase n=1 Tax=Candidatus Liberibacter sp. TaxID=34022 RepID=UPI0015F52AC5|nr:diphosphomevalonate decarboxylase [Candidatus Liberibacter sp.]MBA5724369.1 diphosphomevalonate decarboxylase [Candidatus Liberibacter sp.]